MDAWAGDGDERRHAHHMRISSLVCAPAHIFTCMCSRTLVRAWMRTCHLVYVCMRTCAGEQDAYARRESESLYKEGLLFGNCAYCSVDSSFVGSDATRVRLLRIDEAIAEYLQRTPPHERDDDGEEYVDDPLR